MGGDVLKSAFLRAAGLVWALAASAALGACDIVLGIPDRTLDPHLVCANGACTCGEGFADCDGNAENGCEAALQTDAANCGTCGNDCKNGTCKAGACACEKNFADCDGKATNGCETSLENDADNCGACGHGCLGSACKNSVCQPIQIGMHPYVNTLGLAGGSLYIGVCEESSPVLRIPLAGGATVPVTTVASNKSNGICDFSLTIFGDTIYWNEEDNAGTTAPILSNPLNKVTMPKVVVPNAAASPIVATSTLLYWSDQSAMALMRVPVKGGAVETLYSEFQPEALAVDEDNAYFSDGSGVYAVPHTGTTVTKLSSVSSIYTITVYKGTLYLGATPGVYSLPLTGGEPTLLSKHGYPYATAIDDTGIYFGDGVRGTVDKLPLTGGEPTDLATGLLILPDPIALDAEAVYYISNYRLYKVAK